MSTQSPEKDKKSLQMEREKAAEKERQRADMEARKHRKNVRQENYMIEKMKARQQAHIAKTAPLVSAPETTTTGPAMAATFTTGATQSESKITGEGGDAGQGSAT